MLQEIETNTLELVTLQHSTRKPYLGIDDGLF